MTTPPDERGIFERVVLGLSSPAQIAGAINRDRVEHFPSNLVKRRWGTINAINVNNTVDVNIGGVIVPGVRRRQYYAPSLGDVCSIDIVDTDMVVTGTVAPSPLNDYNGRLNSLSNTVTGHTSQITSLGTRVTAVETATVNTREARYYATSAQSIPNFTNTNVSITNVDYSTTDVTLGTSGAGSTWTLNRGGIWVITATVRFVSSANGGERYLAIVADGIVGEAQGGSSTGTATTLSVSYTERNPSGAVITLVAFQGSGAALNLEPNTGAWVHITLVWLRA